MKSQGILPASLMSSHRPADKISMAVFLALALVLFQLIAVPSSADAGQLLSYAELMRLPKDQRIVYIQGVRTILIELSKNPDAKFSDVEISNRSRLKAWLELIDSQMVTAEARDVSSSPKTCAQNRQCEAALRDCFLKNNTFVKWNSVAAVYECDLARPVSAFRSMSAMGDMDRVLDRVAKGPDPQFSKGVAPVIRLGRPDPAASSASATGAAQAAPAPRPSAAGEPEVIRVRPRAADAERLLLSSSVKKASQSIEEFAQAAARGRVRGLKCRSQNLPHTSTAESVGWASLPVCTDEQEKALEERFHAQQSPVQKALAEMPGPSPTLQLKPQALQPEPQPEAQPEQPPSPPVIQPVPAPNLLQARPLNEATREYGRKIPRSEIQPYLDRRENPDGICEQERSTLGDGKLVFVPTAPGEAHGYCMNESGYTRFQAGALDPDRLTSSTTSEASAPVRQPAQGPEPASSALLINQKFAACAPKPQTCQSRDTIRRSFYQGNLPCVFAGMVSELKNGNRRCQAVTEYKIGDKTLKCENGQTMCNPMLFGTILGSSPETPICVGRGQAVTEHCGKISNARDAELFLNRNVSGLQDKWDEFKRDLENTCKEGTVSAKFHCHECNLMQSRLFELHARVVKNPCETSVDDGIRSRIKDRSAPTAR